MAEKTKWDRHLFGFSLGLTLITLCLVNPWSFGQQPATPWPTAVGADAPDAQLKPAQTVPVTVTQTTTEQSTTTTTTTVNQSIELQAQKIHNKLKRDRFIGWKLARDPYFYETAQADPSIVAAVCAHRDTATMLAKNRHLDRIADADPLLCRRLCKWHSSALVLVESKHCQHVIALDPEGLYTAVNKYPSLARILAKNQMFNELVAQNPEIGRFISMHMR